MSQASDNRMTLVERLEDIPQFTSEREEAAYWATHELGGELLEQMGPLDDVLCPPARFQSRTAG